MASLFRARQEERDVGSRRRDGFARRETRKRKRRNAEERPRSIREGKRTLTTRRARLGRSAGLRDSGPPAGRARDARGLNRHARGSNGGRGRPEDAPGEPARLVLVTFRFFTRASHRDGLESDGAAPGASGGLQGGHTADGRELERDERHLCGWTVR